MVEFIIPAAYLSILGVLSVYGMHRLVILWLYWRTRDQPPQPGTFDQLPIVTVQLPIFNERNVVVRLIDAACALDWPADRLEIQVLDDSTDDTTPLAENAARRWRDQGLDVTVIHRVDRTGFKAGALEAGTAVAKGELLAVFDADFVPPPDYLRKLVPHFATSPEIGMVQARWGHLNEDDAILTRLSAVLLNGHFVLEHTARNRTGRFFNFNGTAGVWRRACIDAAGGWQHDTLTEDLDLSYRAQLVGWRFVFLKDLVVPAELPAEMRAFKVQQHRWAKGTLQAARKLMMPIWRSDQPFRVKVEATVHMTSNLAYPLVLTLALLMPPSVALRGRSDLHEALLLDLPIFLMATASVALFYAVAEREAHGSWLDRLWRLPFVMGLGIGMAVNQTRAVVEGLFGSDVTFVRTPKAGSGGPSWYASAAGWTPWVEVAMFVYYLAAIGWVIAEGWWASLPFMAMFAFGFGYVGLSSARERMSRRPRPSQALTASD